MQPETQQETEEILITESEYGLPLFHFL